MTNTNASNQIASIRASLVEDLQDKENIRLMVQRATESNLVQQHQDDLAIAQLCAQIRAMGNV